MYSDFLSPVDRLRSLNLPVIALITLLAIIGFLMQYSAGGGSLLPWALPQIVRFMVGFGLMLFIASTDLEWWFKKAYFIYGITFALLLLVEAAGMVGKGAQSWLDLYFFKLQPSEFLKVSLVLAVAAYFHRYSSDDIYKPSQLILPLLMILLPTALVLKQPDLGTALLIAMIGFSLFFAAGAHIYYFAGLSILFLAAIPFAWNFLLKFHQKNRILTFLSPEKDPHGTGYHILQSKIAIGSGGLFGKGYFHGTQGYLNFLPEKQTDFIFTLFSEEFGLFGSLSLLFLYALLIVQCYKIILKNRSKFGQLVSLGIMMTIFIYVSINIAMVMGLVPVVGVPLPMVSYGGSSMITIMIGFGLLLNTDVNHKTKVSKY
ncbi:MAG: rod shape-determining protein RodA [Alphaproteobacteria bacterium RIFCSPLOWO2_01_FULL_45_8]|nr:MAG: rod shape-determining protein RodA [Alphaproteobacteria bacterium GWB1_45_5]OFW76173.1 MAG: rod shape-determining protein RodA [Alphaproteobacteria bacterium GWA1_45_9]OFW89905.1 MAG: rod shape-determining protein RodA [Alphaproteobacteria bacterium RIFCSPHIGHO2_01_FULL_41_14]OFW96024.1 MAG: rod shape-determining protein RodA [Alphaproteobacteria bacterium RIFCSPLOWO2_01_FULL_45_8]HCI48342.1 rod shape-determining protein RodA [Holosporales bacterium]